MCPVVPSQYGESMQNTIVEWNGSKEEFDPHTMLTPPQKAIWICKYAAKVDIRIKVPRQMQQGNFQIGNEGFPQEHLPHPYPTGKL